MPARGRKPLLGTKKFKPIIMGPTFAIGGGLLKEQSCVTLEGPGNKYLLVKKKSPWLCMATSGVTYSKAPLHRTKLLDIFDEVLNAGPDEVSLGVPDKMKSLMTSKSGANTSALAASSSSALAAASPLPTKGKKKNNKRARVELSKVFNFKKTWHASAKHGWRLWRKKGTENVWLHIDDVPLAIQYLHDELLVHGVPLDQAVEASKVDEDDDDEGDEEEDAEHDEDEDDGDEDNSSGDQGSVSSASVSFDRRDLSWQGRVKGATTGKVHRITRCVPMKDENKKTYTPAAFERRKAQIKREVQKWMEQKQRQ